MAAVVGTVCKVAVDRKAAIHSRAGIALGVTGATSVPLVGAGKAVGETGRLETKGIGRGEDTGRVASRNVVDSGSATDVATGIATVAGRGRFVIEIGIATGKGIGNVMWVPARVRTLTTQHQAGALWRTTKTQEAGRLGDEERPPHPRSG